MARRLLDCRTMEIGSLTEKQQERIEKTLDKLNIPKDAIVQINFGTKDEIGKEHN